MKTLPKDFKMSGIPFRKRFYRHGVDRTEMKKTIYELIMLHKGVSL